MVWRACWLFLLLLSVLTLIEPAHAARNLGEMGQVIGEQGVGIAFAAKMVAFVIGLILIIGAIVILATIKKTQTPVAIPIIMLVAGICLMSIVALVGVGSASLFGNDEASGALNELGVN